MITSDLPQTDVPWFRHVCLIFSNWCFVKAKRGNLDGALMDINKCIDLEGDGGLGLQERGILERMKGDLHGSLADLNDSLGQ